MSGAEKYKADIEAWRREAKRIADSQPQPPRCMGWSVSDHGTILDQAKCFVAPANARALARWLLEMVGEHD